MPLLFVLNCFVSGFEFARGRIDKVKDVGFLSFKLAKFLFLIVLWTLSNIVLVTLFYSFNSFSKQCKGRFRNKVRLINCF